MRVVFPRIDAALKQTWKVQAVFFKLTAHDSFPLSGSQLSATFRILKCSITINIPLMQLEILKIQKSQTLGKWIPWNCNHLLK